MHQENNHETEIPEIIRAFVKEIAGDDWDEEAMRDCFANSKHSSSTALLDLFGVAQLCTDLELPPNFLMKLLSADDWTLVLRLIALIEAALTHAISINLNRCELKKPLAFLELGGSRIGKVVLARKLKIIDKDEKRYILKLAEIRNYFIHDVRNATKDIYSYFTEISPSERKGYEKAFRLGFDGKRCLKIKIGSDKYNRRELTRGFLAAILPEYPRIAIWIGAIECLGALYSKTEIMHLKWEMNQGFREIDRLIGSIREDSVSDTGENGSKQ